MPTMYDSIDHLMDYFTSTANTPLNIHPVFQEVTMDIISRIALGQRDSTLFNNPYIDFAKGIFRSPIDQFHTTMPQMFPFVKTPLRFFQNAFKFGSKANAHSLHVNLFKEILKRKNERATKAPGAVVGERVDFIDLFLDAEVPEQKTETTTGVLDKRNLKVAKELSVTEIVWLCFIFLLAGYDTTGKLLTSRIGS